MRETAVDAETIDAVWRKAREIPGLPDTIWRRDRFGMTIRRFDYGRTDTEFGWVVDRLLRTVEEGQKIGRFQPLQWRNASVDAGFEQGAGSSGGRGQSGILQAEPGRESGQ